MKNRLFYSLILLSFGVLSGACQQDSEKNSTSLKSIAQHEKQWTGIGISSDGRIFVNFPTWSPEVPIKVGEIREGVTYPYPDQNSNTEDSGFVAVQSVVVDAMDRLWILDTYNPFFKGVINGGPKLHVYDLKTDTLLRTYNFPSGIYYPNSYFNDVRIDTKNQMAYMTDSGRGGIIVLDLNDGHAARVLDGHSSTQAEVDHLICDGHKWSNEVHSDGIALSPNNDWLYFIALSGYSLYKVPTNQLREALSNNISPEVHLVRKIPATDGILFDETGGLWLGGLENNAVNYLNAKGELKQAIQDKSVRWADSFAADRLGNIYFTTSQIHLPPEERSKYEVLMLDPKKLQMEDIPKE